MKIIIETERLILREVLPTDVDGFFELDSDPEVHKYLGNKPVKDKKQSRDLIDFIRQQYKDHGIGRLAVIEKSTQEFIGWSGLKLETINTNGYVNYNDLGYRFIQRYWGKGFAYESALASLQYGFEQLKLNEIYATADCDNIGSNKILQKVGLDFKNVFDLDGVPHNWYKLDREKYIKSRLER